MHPLERALRMMLDAHEGQTDKGGNPYVLHPLRVMSRLDSDDERIVALLHDVVEDSQAVTLETLRSNGFSESIVSAVDALTRRENETYGEFVQRVSKNPLASRVKIADLTDNMDIKRLSSISDEDLIRLRKYHDALGVLKRVVHPVEPQ